MRQNTDGEYVSIFQTFEMIWSTISYIRIAHELNIGTEIKAHAL